MMETTDNYIISMMQSCPFSVHFQLDRRPFDSFKRGIPRLGFLSVPKRRENLLALLMYVHNTCVCVRRDAPLIQTFFAKC